MVRGIVVPIGYIVEIMGSNMAGGPSGLVAIVRIETGLTVIHQRVWMEGKCLWLMG